MKSIIRVITTIITIFTAVLVSISVSCFTVYAGDINGNEARVIAVATGTFTYGGKTYKAYDSYVSEMYTYLEDDEVDLDEYQAQNAIDMIYENVLTGIEEGYIYEVNPKKDTQNPDYTEMDADQAAKQDTTEKQPVVSNLDEYKIKKEEKKDNPNSAASASDAELKKLFADIDKDQLERLEHSKRPTASEADATIILGDQSIILSSGKKDYIFIEDKPIIPHTLLKILTIVGLIILATNVAVGAVLFVNKCMHFKTKKKIKPRRGHRRRRKIRKACRYVLTATNAVSITLLFVMVSLSVGIFNDNKIVQNIQTSGYFRYAYMEYLADTANITEADATASSDNQSVNISDILQYENFVVQEKVKIGSVLESANDASLGDITLTKTSIAPYIRRIQLDMKNGMIASSIIYMLALIVACVLNVFMDQRRDRGIKSIAISTLFGTAITLAISVIGILIHFETRVFVDPEYLYNFMTDHIEWMNKVFFIVGLFGGVVGMSLVGLYKSRRKSR